MYLDFHYVRTNGVSFHFRHLYCSQDGWSAGPKSYGVILSQCQVRLATIIEFGLTSEPLVRFLKFKRLWKAMDEPSCLEASNCLFLGMNDRKRHKYPFFWSTWSQFWGKMTAFEAVLGCVMVNNIPRKWQPKLAIWPFLAVFGGKPNLWMALEGRNTNIGPNPLGYTSVTSMTTCRNIKLQIFGRTLCIAWLASV